MNSKEIKVRLILADMSIEDFLKRLKVRGCQMSKTAYYRKMNGKSEFDRKEILAIAEELNLSQEEMVEIFFTKKVS